MSNQETVASILSESVIGEQFESLQNTETSLVGTALLEIARNRNPFKLVRMTESYKANGILYYIVDRLMFLINDEESTTDLIKIGEKMVNIRRLYKFAPDVFIYNKYLVCVKAPKGHIGFTGRSRRYAPSIVQSVIRGRLRVLRDLGVNPGNVDNSNTAFSDESCDVQFVNVVDWTIADKLMSDNEIKDIAEAISPSKL